MIKTIAVIKDSVHHTKHPFSKVDNHPKKAQKHRYERRKIREFMRLGDWLAEEQA